MRVIGVLRGKSKKSGKDYTVLHMIGDFEDYQLKDATGNKAENICIPGYVNIEVGDDIELRYGIGYQGKAVVTGVEKVS